MMLHPRFWPIAGIVTCSLNLLILSFITFCFVVSFWAGIVFFQGWDNQAEVILGAVKIYRIGPGYILVTPPWLDVPLAPLLLPLLILHSVILFYCVRRLRILNSRGFPLQ